MRILSGVLALLAMLSPAAAQTITCAERTAVVGKLIEHGEVQTGSGLNGSGQIVEHWMAPETGSWTILVSYKDGRACIVSYGEAWSIGPVVSANGMGAPT